ncbi:Arginine-binding extracellular protein ArtP, partial [Dysosmobacter welbionis]
TRGSHLGLSSVTRRGQGSPGKTQLRSAWRAAFTPSSTWRAQRRAAAATAAAAREKMAAGSRPLRLKPTPQAARARMEKRPVNRLDSAKSTAADSGVLAMGKDLPGLPAGHLGQYGLHHAGRLQAGERRLMGQQYPVGQDVAGQILHIVRGDIVPAGEGGIGFGGPEQVPGHPGAGAAGQLRLLPGGLDQLHDVRHHRIGQADLPDLPGEPIDFLRGEQGAEVRKGGSISHGSEHGGLLPGGGVAHGELEEEAVQLGSGQGEGGLRLHGVLGGQDHEGWGQGIGDAVYGHLPFLHGLQQGGLG